jgi:hypothetical protein
MTQELITKAQAALQGVHGGKWAYRRHTEDAYIVSAIYQNEQGLRCTAYPAVCSAVGHDNAATARFIVEARTLVPQLIARIQELEAQVCQK